MFSSRVVDPEYRLVLATRQNTDHQSFPGPHFSSGRVEEEAKYDRASLSGVLARSAMDSPVVLLLRFDGKQH